MHPSLMPDRDLYGDYNCYTCRFCPTLSETLKGEKASREELSIIDIDLAPSDIKNEVNKVALLNSLPHG